MRKLLEDLIFIGVVKETYKVFGKSWTLKTLTADENLQAITSTRSYDDLSRSNAVKIAALARSIVEVDNVELTDLNEKIEFLGKAQQPLIDMLYEKFGELQNSQEESLKDLEESVKK